MNQLLNSILTTSLMILGITASVAAPTTALPAAPSAFHPHPSILQNKDVNPTQAAKNTPKQKAPSPSPTKKKKKRTIHNVEKLTPHSDN
ncbi:hypothetical protein GW643_17250 [Serratia marcescens]|uniref:hypothetical protein n=1 Tax=Serratia marcescens TaxID=615 RepID=UPI001376F8C2|nr:hypothetical protein [Serratia marcescens]MBH3035809.1 hypothetical protein [Serratia marcescens]MBH3063800.1 hypothetical protein [Serratia marcescens]NCJ12117.1 hypothetical protein [Serratia marcescens]NDJ04673.1 hypothetical protein [Serratia marcescens]